MAIRIAEYAFIAARQFAVWDIGHATITMPKFYIIYIKRTDKTPATTTITINFPDGQVVQDLTYFRNELLRLHEANELSDAEMIDLMGFVNTIITHITNENKNEERLVNVMGGTIIETESEKLIRQGLQQGMHQGEAKMFIELEQENGVDDKTILQKIQEKIGMSLEEAEACLKKYGKQLA